VAYFLGRWGDREMGRLVLRGGVGAASRREVWGGTQRGKERGKFLTPNS